MDETLPDQPAVYVLKDGARIGPFSLDDLLELVDSGEISYDDICLRPGATDCERVRQVLDWEDEAAPPADPALRAPAAPRQAAARRGFPDGDESEPDDEGEETLTDVEDDDEEEDEDLDEDGAAPPAPAAAPRRRAGAPPPSDPGRILYAGHPSVLSFPGTLSAVALALGTGLWLREASGWWLFGGLLTALFGVSWILFRRSLRLYLITPRRIEVVKGFVAKSSNEVRVEDIRAINVHTPGLIGLLGVGTVEFASAGGADIDVAFADVYAAHRIKRLVRRLQDAREAPGTAG